MLSPPAPGPFLIPARLPAHSSPLQPLPSLPHPFLLLLTNSQPLLPHFPLFPPPLPSLPPILHHLHSMPSSTLIRNAAGSQTPTSRPRAAPAVPAVSSEPLAPTTHSLPCGAFAPGPRPLPSEPPSFLTPPPARLWFDHSSTAARGLIPKKDEAVPSAPHPQAHYRPRRSCLLPRCSLPPPLPPPPPLP